MTIIFRAKTVLLTLTLSVLLGISTQGNAQDRTAADFTLPTISGDTITLSEHKDQAVLLVFWATWCPYCKKLLPGIERLHQTYGDKGLKVIAVNVMEDGDPVQYMKDAGYTFTNALEGDSIANNFMVPATPTIAVLSKDNQWHDHMNLSDPNSNKLENSVRTAMGLAPLED